MPEVSKTEQVSRIVALVNQAQSSRLEAELRPFTPFFSALADKLNAILTSFTSGPVKCSVSQFDLETVDAEVLKPHGRGYKSAKSPLKIFFRADRAFDGLLCEVCFGGAGTEMHGGEDTSRPASRIEQFLRSHTFDDLHDSLPEIVKDLADVTLELEEEEQGGKKGPILPPQKCVSASLLVNAYSLSAEMEVLVPLQQLEMLFGLVATAAKPFGKNMGQVMSACPFEIVASLAPQDIGLDSILSLSVGSVLKLKATPSHPSLLHVEGVEIGKGRLNISAEQIAVSLM